MVEYLGVVTAQGVLSVNAFKDGSAGVRNIFGGRAKSYENELAGGLSPWARRANRHTVRVDSYAI